MDMKSVLETPDFYFLLTPPYQLFMEKNLACETTCIHVHNYVQYYMHITCACTHIYMHID